MRKILFSLLIVAGLIPVCTYSQVSFQTKKLSAEIHPVVIHPEDIGPRYSPRLTLIEAPAPGSSSYRGYLLALKDRMASEFTPDTNVNWTRTASGATQPMMGNNFEGNVYDFSVPNDNDMAISNGGSIVSVINSTVYMMNDTGAVLQSISLDDMFDTLGLFAQAFDPKVTYDPDADRFILVSLNGFTDSTSNIMVAFSQSNDPTGAWNLYALPGNPMNDTTWTDYPIIAVTKDEFFITVNLLKNDEPWQTGFVQSIIWQLDKEDGYAGATLDNKLWFDIGFGGAPIRNLCPIRGGAGNEGPNLYLLSNRNFSVSNDSIFIVEVTDTIDAPGATLNVDMKQSDQVYGMPPNGHQKFNLWLQTNDSRILGGFLLNDKIQFVGNTINPATGLAGIYHGQVHNLTSTRTVTGHIIGDTVMDFGYPNLSWTGNTPADRSSIISFDHTSVDSLAGISCVYYDGSGDYSDRLTIKKGLTHINIVAGVYERWGDYSGSQRKYNEPGTVWMSGFFGKTTTRQGTWIAELTAPPFIGVDEVSNLTHEMKAFPNPVQDRIFLDFTLNAPQVVDISLYDVQGRLVKKFIHDRADKGTNQFSFDVNALGSGIYFLRISNDASQIASTKIVKP